MARISLVTSFAETVGTHKQAKQLQTLVESKLFTIGF